MIIKENDSLTATVMSLSFISRIISFSRNFQHNYKQFESDINNRSPNIFLISLYNKIGNFYQINNNYFKHYYFLINLSNLKYDNKIRANKHRTRLECNTNLKNPMHKYISLNKQNYKYNCKAPFSNLILFNNANNQLITKRKNDLNGCKLNISIPLCRNSIIRTIATKRLFEIQTSNYHCYNDFQLSHHFKYDLNDSFILSSHTFVELESLLNKIYKSDEINNIKVSYEELKAQVESPEFFKMSNKTNIMIELTRLKNILDEYNKFEIDIQNGRDFYELAKQEEDTEMLKDIEKQMGLLQSMLLEKEFESLMHGKMDKKDCFVEIHAGAGGTESCDWVTMLRDMYINWCQHMNFKVSIQSETKGLVAGLKSCLLKIEGDYAYGWMRTESGVHRLVRISPFDSGQRRHTSFAEVYPFPVIDDTIRIDIHPNDLVFETMRASGAGGQHVNKTDSAVRVTHIPTGISVRSQEEREQGRNKQNALRILMAKLYQLEEQKLRQEKSEKGKERPDVSFGQQIRSYVLHPYKAIKDIRTQYQINDPEYLFSGEGLTEFMKEALKKGL